MVVVLIFGGRGKYNIEERAETAGTTAAGTAGKAETLSVCVCVCVCFLLINSGHQVRWTYQPGSHRRNVTQDF